MLLRGETVRNGELPDLFAVPLKNEGATDCRVLCMIVDNGKTNAFGKMEYGVTIRHKELWKCLISQLACYLFFRWDIEREPPPLFKRRSDWYRTKILKGGQNTHPLAYATQLQWVNEIFDRCQISSYKKTHAGRKQGAQHAELLGVSESQIQRAGRWNTDAMSNAYLSHIPRKFVRAAAGFPSSGRGDYFIPRAQVLPPDSLVRKIWPWVDEWIIWFQQNENNVRDDDQLQEQNEGDRNDLAGKAFLRLLDYLRTVLLQDSVLLRNEFPHHPLFHHSIFSDPEYLDFDQRMRQMLAVGEPQPQEVLIRQVVPIIADQMAAMENNLMQRWQEMFDYMRTERNHQRTVLDDVFSGRTPIYLNSNISSLLQNPPTAAQTVASSSTVLPETPVPIARTSTASSALLPPDTSSSNVRQLPDQPVKETGEPIYIMSRTVTTVDQLWREWFEGLAPNPSIQALELKYRALWRQKDSEKTWYSRRKVIIDYVCRTSEIRRISAVLAVARLEEVRMRSSWSLHQLYKEIAHKKSNLLG
jgi:hypothetical protein